MTEIVDGLDIVKFRAKNGISQREMAGLLFIGRTKLQKLEACRGYLKLDFLRQCVFKRLLIRDCKKCLILRSEDAFRYLEYLFMPEKPGQAGGVISFCNPSNPFALRACAG